MNPATTVPSIADVDPDLVVGGGECLSSADWVGKPANEAQPGVVPTEAAAPSDPLADATTAAIASADGPLPDEAAPPDYVADYDDDQTFGIVDDVVDQRIPFT